MDISQQEFENLYQMGEFLGEGANGKVHKAKRITDGMKFAVKMIPLPQNQDLRHYIIREKEVMRKLSHQNIVKCVNFATITNEKHQTRKQQNCNHYIL